MENYELNLNFIENIPTQVTSTCCAFFACKHSLPAAVASPPYVQIMLKTLFSVCPWSNGHQAAEDQFPACSRSRICSYFGRWTSRLNLIVSRVLSFSFLLFVRKSRIYSLLIMYNVDGIIY